MPLNKMENSEIKSHHYTLTNFIVSEKRNQYSPIENCEVRTSRSRIILTHQPSKRKLPTKKRKLQMNIVFFLNLKMNILSWRTEKKAVKNIQCHKIVGTQGTTNQHLQHG
jgi:hypothetical protein